MAYRKLIREIVSRLQDLLLESRRTAMTAVNAEMLRAYWEMEKVLDEAEDRRGSSRLSRSATGNMPTGLRLYGFTRETNWPKPGCPP